MNTGKELKHSVLSVIAMLAAALAVFVVIHFSQTLDPFLRVVNLMGTLFHESGHTVMALISRGSVTGMMVNPDGSGYAMISGGSNFLILPAGYLTCTLLTALMFLVNNRTRWGEVIPFLMSIIVIWTSFTFGPRLENGQTTVLVGAASGFFLMFIGMHPHVGVPRGKWQFTLPTWLWMSVVNIIAAYYGLAGILSLEYLSRFAAHGNPDDVSRFTDLYFPSWQPTSMAFVLMGISIFVWLIVIGLSLRGLFKKQKESA